MRCERATDPYPVKLRWTNVVIYALPVGHRKKFLAQVPRALDKVIGGWQLTVTTFFNQRHVLDSDDYRAGSDRYLLCR